MSQKKNIGGLISILVLSIVGLALTPSINALVTTTIAHATTGDINMSATARAIVGLFPLFWVILMISIPTAYIAVWLRGT